MKKVLIITYSWPPSNEVSIHRILRLGRWLPKHGLEAIVLTPLKRIDYRKSDDNNLSIASQYFKKVIFTDDFFSQVYIKLSSGQSLVAKAIRFITNWAFFIPDRQIHWLIPAIRKGIKTIRNENIDVIWASMPPYTSGLIGAYISKKTNTPLLLDYRDPWTLSKFHMRSPIKRRFCVLMEKWMLKHAGEICTTSNPMSRLFIENKFFSEEKIHTITNSTDSDLQNINAISEGLVEAIKNDKIIITHVGSFYGDRQPDTFIEALHLLLKDNAVLFNKIKVVFVGNKKYDRIIELCKKYDVINLFQFHGYVNYEQAMFFIKQADILLLLNGLAAHNNIFIPGKFFDYLAVEKPILFIGDGQPKMIINELNIGETAAHDPNMVFKKIEYMISNLNSYKINKDKLLNYQSEHISKSLANVLLKTCE